MYVEAPVWWHDAIPAEMNGAPSIFLAGGITDCPDWQRAARMLIGDHGPVALFNPRRENFPMQDPAAARKQIEWEYAHLRAADVILFWFASGPSPQPITLFELGRHLEREIVVGCDPGYIRRQDVIIQLELARPEVVVFDNLREVCALAVEKAVNPNRSV